MKLKHFYLFLVLSILLYGCVSIDDVRPTNINTTFDGKTVVYKFPYDVVFNIAKEAAEENLLVIKELKQEKFYILADDSGAITPYGEVIGIYFKKIDKHTTKVTVNTKMPTVPLIKVNREDYKLQIHNRIRKKLDLY